jgi:hypothetical protein
VLLEAVLGELLEAALGISLGTEDKLDAPDDDLLGSLLGTALGMFDDAAFESRAALGELLGAVLRTATRGTKLT